MQSAMRRLLRNMGYAFFGPLYDELRSSKEAQLMLCHSYRDMAARGTLPGLSEVGFRCHSQFEEDGILLYLFALIGTTDRIAVEMCAGDGHQCNTTNLIVSHGWQGLLFDGDPANVERGRKFFAEHKDTFLWPPRFRHSWITAENINDLIRNEGISGEIDLFSLDIDGMDYWVWKALECIQPRVVVCETHNIIGPERALTVPYDPNFRRKIPDYHSASLAAMSKLASGKGYRLVGTHRYGFNAFFVRNGIAEDVLPAVSVASCLQHPIAQNARKERWPKVKDLDRVEV